MAEIKYVSQEYVSYYPQTPDLVDPPLAAPVATLSTSTSVSVAFTPAATGGAATSFLVTAYLVPNLTPTTITGTGSSSPVIVSGLGPDAVYRFKVQGVNAGGIGPVSYPSNSVGFGTRVGEDDEHGRTNLGEGADGHHYFWDDRSH